MPRTWQPCPGPTRLTGRHYAERDAARRTAATELFHRGIVACWTAIIREDGPEALLGHADSAHQGPVSRGLPIGFFHALRATRLDAGTVCDGCAGAGREAALGLVGGADPESVALSDLVVAWGSDLVTTNVHLVARVEAARRAWATLVVVDPKRGRTVEGVVNVLRSGRYSDLGEGATYQSTWLEASRWEPCAARAGTRRARPGDPTGRGPRAPRAARSRPSRPRREGAPSAGPSPPAPPGR